MKRLISLALQYGISAFLAYLRGIETTGSMTAVLVASAFLAYLRGIETRKVEEIRKGWSRFLAYLRGIETLKCNFSDMSQFSKVFSLPKRD
ncbi:hypothetical protein TTE2654 [Caldanaerobacter subterraneus subsp. tengcongensis MB4]|uniref:Uncharacterized protein n=1 Tax=Caldanaerobacter subterraneus subsp. tengcongensis (strain DSM 15242 / JCM 11007 / NBRC 100824 / MB4) TaxID=273068 RepID=Q8R6X9_CALS4|nr:hypothetical protein TTE2654 [Caldanaerobacter subterraneus subsp. tengcongensis MB4]